MEALRKAIILAMMVGTVALQAQQSPPQPAQTVSAVRIISPAPGARITDNFVLVKFEVTQPASAAGTPNFHIRLDDTDPVTTTSQDHTFTGLTPGQHTVIVQLVDANEIPVPNTRSEVRFTVVQRAPARGPSSTQGNAEAAGLFEAEVIPAALQEDVSDQRLPASGSPLPLLALVGFGVLVGGIASAMKAR
jgi:hypothetical protein